MSDHVGKIERVAFTPLQALACTVCRWGREMRMQNKYTAVRARLELAQACLEDVDEIDRGLSLALDQIIETVLMLEHRRMSRSDNVVPFRRASKA